MPLTFLFGELVPRCTHSIDKHYRGYYALQLATAGSVDLSIGPARQILTAPPTHVWSSYPGPRIRFHAHPRNSTWTHRYLAFKGSRVKRWIADGIFPVAPQPAADLPDLPARFDALLDLSRRTDPRSLLRAANQLEAILIDIADRHPASREHDPVVSAAQRALDTLATPDYPALASSLGVSESTLRRRFTRALGLAPHEYLVHARIARARELLADTDLPVKTIADRLNYRDVYFFSRQFRHITGVPPATYRRTRLG